jgi:D-serine deaminase-like pyridoxal phosphate-dependent protein
LLFYRDLIRQNIHNAVRMVGDASRLRPHVKTHKTREIVRLELDAGIRKHKCATLAEAEMVAGCGAPDVLLAYNVVQLRARCPVDPEEPQDTFSVTATIPTQPSPVDTLTRRAKRRVLDLDVGMHRTGIPAGEKLPH